MKKIFFAIILFTLINNYLYSESIKIFKEESIIIDSSYWNLMPNKIVKFNNSYYISGLLNRNFPKVLNIPAWIHLFNVFISKSNFSLDTINSTSLNFSGHGSSGGNFYLDDTNILFIGKSAYPTFGFVPLTSNLDFNLNILKIDTNLFNSQASNSYINNLGNTRYNKSIINHDIGFVQGANFDKDSLYFLYVKSVFYDLKMNKIKVDNNLFKLNDTIITEATYINNILIDKNLFSIYTYFNKSENQNYLQIRQIDSNLNLTDFKTIKLETNYSFGGLKNFGEYIYFYGTYLPSKTVPTKRLCILKFDKNFNLIWQSKIYKPQSGGFNDIVIKDNNIVAVGTYGAGDLYYNYLAVLDSNSKLLDEKSWRVNNINCGLGAVCLSDNPNNVVVAGYYYPDSLSKKYFISEISIDTLLEVNDNKTEVHKYPSFQFYAYKPHPQPASQSLKTQIYWDQSFDINKSIVGVADLYGNIVSPRETITLNNVNAGNAELEWNCSGVSTGIYFILINHNGMIDCIPVMVGK